MECASSKNAPRCSCDIEHAGSVCTQMLGPPGVFIMRSWSHCHAIYVEGFVLGSVGASESDLKALTAEARQKGEGGCGCCDPGRLCVASSRSVRHCSLDLLRLSSE